jgi:signal transduction histidine kinase
VEIHYSSPNLTAPEQLRFRHRLAGLEQDWVEAGDRRAVFYNHLPPGSYKFQVMVGGPDGQWHESPESLRLVILPRWWERRWTQAGFVLLLLAAASGTVWQVERAKSRRLLLSLEVQRTTERERRRIAQDLHDDLGTSLTEISLLSELAARPSASTGEVQAKLGGIAEKSLEMVRALDEIVWAVNPRNDTLPNLVNYLCLFAQDFLGLSRIQCRLEVAEGLPALKLNAEQRHTLYLIVKEVLANAVKYSNADEVWLRISLEGTGLKLVVEDNGRGFDLAKIRPGRNGLENVRSRMTALGGHCTIQSAIGRGTSVTLRLPLG